jgi:DnaJ-class molecular chaperone
MRIDRCKGCGEYIDIASDHKPECPTRKKGHEVIPDDAVEAAAQPERTTCPDCGGDGSQANDCTCPGWVSVDSLAHADLKSLLASNDLSLGAP